MPLICSKIAERLHDSSAEHLHLSTALDSQKVAARSSHRCHDISYPPGKQFSFLWLTNYFDIRY